MCSVRAAVTLYTRRRPPVAWRGLDVLLIFVAQKARIYDLQTTRFGSFAAEDHENWKKGDASAGLASDECFIVSSEPDSTGTTGGQRTRADHSGQGASRSVSATAHGLEEFGVPRSRGPPEYMEEHSLPSPYTTTVRQARSRVNHKREEILRRVKRAVPAYPYGGPARSRARPELGFNFTTRFRSTCEQTCTW